MMRTGNFLVILFDGTCIIFHGGTKISAGKQQKQCWESFKPKLSGQTNFLIFLLGHPCTLVGNHFKGVATGTVSKGDGVKICVMDHNGKRG